MATAFVRMSKMAAVVVLFTQLGCGADPLEPGRVTLTVDADSYTSTYLRGSPPFEEHGFTVIATISNDMDRGVIIQSEFRRESPVYTVRAQGNEFGTAYSRGWTELTSQLVVPPRSSRSFPLRFIGLSRLYEAVPSSRLDGRLMMSVYLMKCRREGPCIIVDEIFSPGFDVFSAAAEAGSANHM